MVKLRRMNNDDRQHVSVLSVTPEQTAFVDPVSDTLSENNEIRDNFVIEHDRLVVGFFQVDARSQCQAIPGNLELHEVCIGERYQGIGLGKAFVLSLEAFVRGEYPKARSMCLTVNCNNLSAYRLYQLGGFVDTGGLRQEGRSGPQHIMQLSWV